MTPVIEVRGLTKRFGGRAVVDGISFHVERREIFGILGPNGAGKTTAVECMEGLRRRDAGQVRILGLDPRTDGRRLHQRLGVQLQETQLQDKIRVREALELYASFCISTPSWASTTGPPRWPRASSAACCPGPKTRSSPGPRPGTGCHQRPRPARRGSHGAPG